ncbi:MAG TPA: hypothetical protein VN881_01655 [Candidatus Acidoferrales bacterium]|nr:hypothetical protein [Candidatus Acidoferrales bacterium]
MKLFGRKDRKNGRPSATDGTRVTAHSGGAPLAHRITKDLERAETLAAMLAHSRAALVVEVADLLAGMYIYDWERLSQFWDGNDEIEIFLQQICRISPQRWHHWIADYDQQRREEEPRKVWQLLTGAKAQSQPANEAPLSKSAELQAVLQHAELLAPGRDMVEGRAVPILTCECVLLAIAKTKDSEIGHRLVATGLNVASLEQSARNPKHAPRH